MSASPKTPENNVILPSLLELKKNKVPPSDKECPIEVKKAVRSILEEAKIDYEVLMFHLCNVLCYNCAGKCCSF